MAALTQGYTESKPINDQLVDASLRIQALTAEVYRRAIMKQLPDVPLGRKRTVMRISCTVHPNQGILQISQRVAFLREEGIEIVSVDYDENTGEYSCYAEPEFPLTYIPTRE